VVVAARADAAASQANKVLAAALKVDRLVPAVQLFRSKQLAKVVKPGWPDRPAGSR